MQYVELLSPVVVFVISIVTPLTIVVFVLKVMNVTLLPKVNVVKEKEVDAATSRYDGRGL